MAIDKFTLEQAEAEIAELRGLIDVITEAHTKDDATDTPVVPASGLISFSSAGHEKYTSADGSAYNTGRATMAGPPTNQSITSATDVIITGMTASVAAGTYRISAQIGMTQGAGAFAQNIVLHGPAGAAFAGSVNFFLSSSGDSNGLSFTTTFGTITSPAFVAGSVFWLQIEGVLTFTAAGTFSVQASEGTSTHPFTVLANSFCDLMPVT